MLVVGLDIGGANLKAASTTGVAVSAPFEIWRAPRELPARISEILSRLSPADRLAVTMTAELADCFQTKRIGVEFILNAVEASADGVPVRVWTTGGRFVSPAEACERPMTVAAANWHALATWAGRFAREGESLLVDIGSTTADIVPLRAGVPYPAGLTDVDRLLAGELVYSGVRRTPVFAVAPHVPLRGMSCPLAAEWFATMLDVYLILGWQNENPADCSTANGQPATIAHAHDRLARAVCCDRTELNPCELRAMAEFLAERQLTQLCAAIDSVCGDRRCRPQMAIVAGQGAFLARRALARRPATAGGTIMALNEKFNPRVAEAACALAVAELAADER